MKKYIFPLLAFALLSTQSWGQTKPTEAQTELNAYMDDGLVTFKSQDEQYSFRVGGRLAVDGAYYIDDYTDRSSGADLSSARIRIFSKLGSKLDVKFDIDFASGVSIKDAYLRWHTDRAGFLRVGHFAEPFSAENIASTFDYNFINKSATNEAFAPGRALGVSYRHYSNYLWGEGGIFSQKIGKSHSNGDMGWGVTARLLARYTGEDWAVHAGGAFSYRIPDANGFANGNDDYNRSVTLASSLESAIDKTNMLYSKVNNVKQTLKYNIEGLATWRNLYLTGEYTHGKYVRERDWDYNFQTSLGTLMGTFTPTPEIYKSFFGPDTNAEFSGYQVQAGWLIRGGDYRYNKVDALMNRPGRNSLELIARYNHTDLNYIEPGSIFMNGKFYSNEMMASWGMANTSVVGGVANTFTVGVNYYFTHNIAMKVNYSYAHLDQQYSDAFRYDKNLHTLQMRLQLEF